MDPLAVRRIGRTRLQVTCLGIGGAPLGSLYFPVPEAEAIATVRRGLELGLSYLDTAPHYGLGRSESYFGKALAGRRRETFVVSTKVGRVLQPAQGGQRPAEFADLPPLAEVFDFSRDGVLRSLESSLQRLKLDRVDILLLHDPDTHYDQAMQEAYPTLRELRSQGVVEAIGAGMNQWEMLLRFAKEGDFDCFLLAGRYTLLEQGALPQFLSYCREKGISVIIGGPYNSGILASDLTEGAKYNYRDAPPEVLAKARRIKTICDQHGVPLKAAALQFVLAHPAVAAVIPGARTPQEVEENFRLLQHPIPAALWQDLKREGLLEATAPTPAG